MYGRNEMFRDLLYQSPGCTDRVEVPRASRVGVHILTIHGNPCSEQLPGGYHAMKWTHHAPKPRLRLGSSKAGCERLDLRFRLEGYSETSEVGEEVADQQSLVQ